MAFLKPTESKPTSGMASDDLDSSEYSKPASPMGDSAQDGKPMVGDLVELSATNPEEQLKDLARAIRAAHRKIERSAVAIVASVIDMGGNLAAARDLLAVQGSRGFGRFLKSVKISRSQAHRAIQSWETFSNCPSVGQIELPALYLLSKANTPQPAIDQAVQLADNGETVTVAKARELIAHQLPERKRTSLPPPEIIQVSGGTVAVTAREGLTIEQILLRAIKAIRDAKAQAA